MNAITRSELMLKRLKEEFKSTAVDIRPRSPQKYPEGDASIMVWCEENHKMRRVCGISIQAKTGPYKLWLETHKEWELITKYPVKVWAKNGTGRGSGHGYYLDSEDDTVNEIKDFLSYYYAIN